MVVFRLEDDKKNNLSVRKTDKGFLLRIEKEGDYRHTGREIFVSFEDAKLLSNYLNKL